MVDRQLEEIKLSEEMARSATQYMDGWVERNVDSVEDYYLVREYQIGSDDIKPGLRDIAEEYAYTSIGYKRCESPLCTTQEHYVGGWILNTNFKVDFTYSGDPKSGLCRYCNRCRVFSPYRNHELKGRYLDKYAKYSKYLYEKYVTGRDEGNRRGLPDPELFWSIKRGIELSTWSDEDARCSEGLINLEYGTKSCNGDLCSSRKRRGRGSQLCDVNDFANKSSRPDGLDPLCRACNGESYNAKKEKAKREAEEKRAAMSEHEVLYNKRMKEAWPEATRERRECPVCLEQVPVTEFPIRGASMKRSFKRCNNCKATDERRKRLTGSYDSRVCSATYVLGDKVNDKNIFHMFMKHDLAYNLLMKYAVDVDLGILVHRSAERLGPVLRAPGDEAYSKGPNQEKKIVLLKGQKPVDIKYVLSVLYDLTDPNGTIVYRNMNRFDHRPSNLFQWHVNDPVKPYTEGAIPPPRTAKLNEGLRKKNERTMKGLIGAKSRVVWYRSSTERELGDSVPAIITEASNKKNLYEKLDEARRKDKPTIDYIRSCDEKYLAHATESLRVATQTRDRGFHSIGKNSSVAKWSVDMLERIKEAIDLATVK